MAGEVSLLYHVNPNSFISNYLLRKCLFKAIPRTVAFYANIIKVPFDTFPTHLIGEFKSLYHQIQIDVAVPLLIKLLFSINNICKLLGCFLEIVKSVFKSQFFGRAKEDFSRCYNPVSKPFFIKGNILHVNLYEGRKIPNLFLYEVMSLTLLVVVSYVNITRFASISSSSVNVLKYSSSNPYPVEVIIVNENSFFERRRGTIL